MVQMVITDRSHVQSALDFKTLYLPNTYIGIGRTTPWSDEQNPPACDPAANQISEVIGYKLVSSFTLVRPPNAGETIPENAIIYRDTPWIIISDEQAYLQNATYVYISADIVGDELPLATFRQTGLYLNLIPNSGVTQPNLIPSQVQSYGILKGYVNDVPVTRTVGQTTTLEFLLSF